MSRFNYLKKQLYCFLHDKVQIPEPDFFSDNMTQSLLVKSNGLYLRPSKSSQDPVVVIKFEFCAHSARLMRKLDHAFLWILSSNTGLWQCSIEKSKEIVND